MYMYNGSYMYMYMFNGTHHMYMYTLSSHRIPAMLN